MPQGTIGFNPMRGFLEAAGDDRQRTHQQALLRDQRELSILESLAKSPDTDISSAAIAGLLNFSDPRKKRKGIAGFIGETEGHPAMGLIRNLLQTPVIETDSNKVERGLPGFSPGQLSTAPPAMGSAAQAGTSPVTGGAMASPAPVASQNPNVPPPAQTGLPTPPPDYKPKGSPTTVRMRQAFLSPEEQHLRNARAKAQGDVEGEVAGLVATGIPEDRARELVSKKYERLARGGAGTAAGFQRVAIELPDGTQHMAVFDTRQGRYVDPDTQQPFENARPLSRTGSKSFGVDREAIAMEEEFGGIPYAQQTPANRAIINQAVIDRAAQKAGEITTGRGAAAADVPLTKQQIEQQERQDKQRIWGITTNLREDWQVASAPQKMLARQFGTMKLGMAAALAGHRSAGDQAVLVTFQKMLDELSVVREAEYLRSGVGLSMRQQLQGKLEHIIQGGANVPVQELQSYVDLAGQIYGLVEAHTSAVRNSMMDSVTHWGARPVDVFGMDAPQTGPPPAAPGQATPGSQQAGPAAAQAGAPPPAPAQSAARVGDLIQDNTGKSGKIVAINPLNGAAWGDWMGTIPPEFTLRIRK